MVQTDEGLLQVALFSPVSFITGDVLIAGHQSIRIKRYAGFLAQSKPVRSANAVQGLKGEN